MTKGRKMTTLQMRIRTQLAAELLAGAGAKDPFREEHEKIARMLCDETVSNAELLHESAELSATYDWLRHEMPLA